MTDTLDLTAYRLTKPVVVRELDYEALLTARKQQFTQLWTALRAANPDLPDVNTLNLNSDPGAILLQDAAFGDLLFVAELNDTARVVRLVDFATGTDLDLHAAEFADTSFARLTDETDAELRARIKTRRRGSSAAGPDDWFAYHALGAHADVAEVAVSEPGGAVVRVAVRAKSGTGVPSAEVLTAVREILTDRAVRPRCRQVEVVTCRLRTIALTAGIWLYPDTPIEVFEAIRDDVPAALTAERALGRDVTRTALLGRLAPSGVHSVDLSAPAADAIIEPDEVIAYSPVAITFAGRKW